MPARTLAQRLARPVLARWPFVQRASLGLLDVALRVALRPFRRRRIAGRPAESGALVSNTAAYNEAAERYFADFGDTRFLLDKPYSDTRLAAKHLIDAGVLIDALRLRPGDIVAELGAGSGWLSHILNRFGCRTVAIDVSPTAVSLARQLFERDPRTNWTLEPEFLAYDGRRLPLDDGSCDRIVINDAFHHVPNQREVLTEMFRVLRGDGLVAMSEPGYGHGAAAQSVAEAEHGVLENELVLEDLAALARAVGFQEVTVIASAPLLRHEIPVRDLGAFMGGKGVAAYWKAFCGSLERHHYIVLHKAAAAATTRRPSRLAADIAVLVGADGTLAPGARHRVRLRLANIGDTRWLAGEPSGRGWTRLGGHLYRAAPREIVDFDWFRCDLPRDVAPGERVVVDAGLPPVAAAGEYLVEFDLVVEGLAWFAEWGSAPASVRLRVAGTGVRPGAGNQ